MRRRAFITLLGGAAAWPRAADAQQQDRRVQRIGMLEIGDEADRIVQARQRAMRDGLAKLGWTEGRNAQFDIRFSGDDADRMRTHADELVRLAPDIIAVVSGPATHALLQRTRTIPIIFTNVGDPVAFGILKNIARPEGNATGTRNLYQSLGGKWLELLKQAAPHLTRVALIFVPEIVNDQYVPVIDRAAEVLGVKVIRAPYRNTAELEQGIDAFAAEPNGGLLMLPPPPARGGCELINRLALKHRLPTIYTSTQYAADGFMLAYGADGLASSLAAASYVDRFCAAPRSSICRCSSQPNLNSSSTSRRRRRSVSPCRRRCAPSPTR